MRVLVLIASALALLIFERRPARRDGDAATGTRASEELAKLRAERRKVELEVENFPRAQRLEQRRAWAGLAAYLAAAVGIGTILFNVYGLAVERGNRARDEVTRLMTGLGDQSAPVRAASAISMKAHLSGQYRQELVDGLAHALGMETEHVVQSAMVATIRDGGRESAASLRTVLLRMPEELNGLINQLGVLRRQLALIGRGEIENTTKLMSSERSPEASGPLERSEGEIASSRAREVALTDAIRGRQSSMLAMILAIRDLNDACTPVSGCSRCSPNLERQIFNEFSFDGYGDQLCGAYARGTRLVKANLGYLNLSGANFTHAFLNGAILFEANLTGADFSGAHLEMESKAEREPRMATFNRSDLTRAIFRDACLQGADFRSSNVTAEQVRDAWTFGAVFDPKIEAEVNGYHRRKHNSADQCFVNQHSKVENDAHAE